MLTKMMIHAKRERMEVGPLSMAMEFDGLYYPILDYHTANPKSGCIIHQIPEPLIVAYFHSLTFSMNHHFVNMINPA